jgi:cell division cycle protein 37
MVNTKPEKAEEDSEEVREQKHKTFVEKYEKQIKHFGELGRGHHVGGETREGPAFYL